MVDNSALPAEGDGTVSTLMAADLQDHLMTASNDLDRLQRLLADATDTLLARFQVAADHIGSLRRTVQGIPHFDAVPLNQVLHELGGAVVALQFQDMASQLIAHTDRRLRSCADLLARDALADDGAGEAVTGMMPLRPNPVTQDEVDAGSITLF
jgi:hypothetical protein